jgi:hypothetical protein
MSTEAMLAALALFLPDKTLEYFDITTASFEEGEVRLTLLEKDIPPPYTGATSPKFHSYHEMLVSDFPIRGKPSVLTFKRRYWQVEGEKEVTTHPFPVAYLGFPA